MRRRIAVVAGTAVTVVAAASGFAAANRDGSSATASPAAAAQTAGTTTATAEVTRADLVQSESYKGTLGYADVRTLTATGGGTVTGLAAEAATVKRGGALYAVDAAAVRLMYGTIPAYRALGPGVSDGTDVRQLETNLVALGFGASDLTVDVDWTAATTRAVKRWQDALGVSETGRVEFGSVVFLTGQVRIGEHKVSVGAGLQPGAPVLAVTSTDREVTVDLQTDEAGIATVGAAVTVEVDDGRTAKATVSEIAAVAHSAGTEEDAGTVIPVTITLSSTEASKLGTLDQAPVEVGFEKSRASGVLTVPVPALVALAEGGYAVEVATETGSRLLGVEIGSFADGRVEVSGEGLREGASVVVPS